ncbi:MAG: lamin tail domain-containing protein [Myxococcota bacterium]|nr:lamin tail domain-containing protein [Myxococcota bacterium]
MRIYALLLALVCACSFNERDFGDRLCTGDEDCPRPDQACIQNTCTQKACTNDLACGTSHDFGCSGGVCVVDTCSGEGDCEPGYACAEGFCQASFNVTAVTSTSNTSIAITFDSPPDATSAAVVGNYAIDGLTVSGTPVVSGSTVTLATSPQTMTSYSVAVAGVTRDFDKAPLIIATGAFTGRNVFRIASATSTSAITVQITFSEAPEAASAANLANYSIGGLGVSGTPVVAGNTVTLTTQPQTQTQYTVTVANVRRATDAEALATGLAVFTGRNDFNLASVTTKSSTSIEVKFDANPSVAQATTLANYSITGLTLRGTPALSGDTVTLTSEPMAGITYTVNVANVTRASDAESLTVTSKDFTGRTPFNVADAVSVTSTSITVTFDAPPNAAQAAMLSNYSVPGLTLTGTPMVSGNLVTLTTAPQTAASYALTVSNVTRDSDAEQMTGRMAAFTGRSPFNVTNATSTSNTTVSMTFSEAPNAGQAAVAANYTIANLMVLGVSVAGSSVTLTTAPQTATTYTVAVANVTRGIDGEALTNATANFTGRAPFDVMSVTTPTSTSIMITFSHPPNPAQATTSTNYAVPGLTLGGTPALAGNSVTITTAPQLAQSYTLTVDNVTRANDSEPLTLRTASFMGRPRFNVMAAASASNVSMTVTFDAPPNAAQATNLANYSIPNLGLSGTPVLNGNTVTLTTTSQVGGQTYNVTVSNVTRMTDAEPLFVNAASFQGRAGFNVISAASLNTTTMSVTFDAPPNAAQALTAANYSVPGLTLSSPTLTGNVVTLTTSAQTAGSFTVTVSNVTRNSDASPLVVNAASFSYVSFNVASAAALTNRTITLTFDAPPAAGTATTATNYTINGGLTVSGTPVLSGSTVTLTTSSQTGGTVYTVTANNVTRASDGSILTNKSATFVGRAAFNVSTAAAPNSGTLTVTFDAPPNPVQAQTLANYSVPGLTLSGTPQLNANTVTLNTSVQSAVMYTLSVANVTRAGDAEPLLVNMRTFTGLAQVTPVISAVTVQTTVPDNGTKFFNTGTATLVITGAEFTGVLCSGVTLDDRNGFNVQINTPATACTVDSGTQITATFPAGIRTNGTTGWSVRVTNAVGTGVSTAKVVVHAGLLVSEVMAGKNGGGNGTREFIELYNPTSNAINVSNLGVQVHVRNGTTDSTLALNVVAGQRTIASRSYMLLVSTQSGASTAELFWDKRDQTYDASIVEMTTNGAVYLSLSTSPQVMVLDKVGWGSQDANGREGTAITNFGNDSRSAQRKPANGGGATLDTDVNNTDFLAPSTSTTAKSTDDPPEP